MSLKKTGGIAAIEEQITVWADGSGQLEKNGALKQVKVSADELVELKRITEKADFFNLKPEYLGSKNTADVIEYNLTCTWGEKKNTVRTQSSAIPYELEPIIIQLNNLSNKN